MADIRSVLSLLSTLFWSIIFLGIGLAIGVFCIWSGWNTLHQRWNWSDFIQTDAEVTEWYVSSRTHTGVQYGVAKTSVSWGLGCKYRYSVDGEDYSGYGQVQMAHTREEAEKAVASHRPGEHIQIWYHPDTPHEPITENKKPTYGNSVWFIIFGIIVSWFLINVTLSVIKEKLFPPGVDQNDAIED